MKEQRRYKRINATATIIYRSLKSEESFTQSTLIDFTPEGIGFVAKKNLENGEAVEITIKFEADQNFTMVVNTVWTNKLNDTESYRVGSFIHRISPEDKFRLMDMYERRSSTIFGESNSN